MESQKFEIEIDGVVKTAEVLRIVELDGEEYVIYTVPSAQEDMSDVMASKLIQDENGNDVLVDIEDDAVRSNVFEIADMLLSGADEEETKEEA